MGNIRHILLLSLTTAVVTILLIVGCKRSSKVDHEAQIDSLSLSTETDTTDMVELTDRELPDSILSRLIEYNKSLQSDEEPPQDSLSRPLNADLVKLISSCNQFTFETIKAQADRKLDVWAGSPYSLAGS